MMASNKKNFIVEYIVVCDYAFQSEGHKPGIIGIFDVIWVRKFPTSHPEFFIFSKLKGKEGSDHKVKLQITDPSGKDVIKNAPEVKVKLSSTGYGHLVQRFINFPFSLAGVYTISLLEEDKKLAKTQLSIIRVKDSGKKDNVMPN